MANKYSLCYTCTINLLQYVVIKQESFMEQSLSFWKVYDRSPLRLRLFLLQMIQDWLAEKRHQQDNDKPKKAD